MMQRHIGSFLLAVLPLLPPQAIAEPPRAAQLAFDAYVASVEERLANQHRSPGAFLNPSTLSPGSIARLQHGEWIIEDLTPSSGEFAPGALLHHWRATAFAPRARPEDLEHLLRDFNQYPRYFAPQVLQAKVLSAQPDHLQAAMRVSQHHVLTVVMDIHVDLLIRRLDAQHGYSISRSTHIAEIASLGTPSEHPLGPREEHGFLWRQNTYWSYEARDGGLYLQLESVSLSRGIPTGLAWVIRPYVESVPRESLAFTLRSTCNALRQP